MARWICTLLVVGLMWTMMMCPVQAQTKADFSVTEQQLQAGEETFQKAIQCNCRKCRGEKGSQAVIVIEELQEKDIAAAKSTKIKHSAASEIDDEAEKNIDDSDSDYQEVQRKRKTKKKSKVQPSTDETIIYDISEDEDDEKTRLCKKASSAEKPFINKNATN
jgi:hypothetical protein